MSTGFTIGATGATSGETTGATGATTGEITGATGATTVDISGETGATTVDMTDVTGATTVDTVDVKGAATAVVDPVESDPTEIVPPDVVDVPMERDPTVKDLFRSVPDVPAVIVPLDSPDAPRTSLAKFVSDLRRLVSILNAWSVWRGNSTKGESRKAVRSTALNASARPTGKAVCTLSPVWT